MFNAYVCKSKHHLEKSQSFFLWTFLILFDRLFEGRVWGLNKGHKHFNLDNRSCFIINKLSMAGRESSLRSVVSRPVVGNLKNHTLGMLFWQGMIRGLERWRVRALAFNYVLAARGRRSAAFYCLDR